MLVARRGSRCVELLAKKYHDNVHGRALNNLERLLLHKPSGICRQFGFTLVRNTEIYLLLVKNQDLIDLVNKAFTVTDKDCAGRVINFTF